MRSQTGQCLQIFPFACSPYLVDVIHGLGAIIVHQRVRERQLQQVRLAVERELAPEDPEVHFRNAHVRHIDFDVQPVVVLGELEAWDHGTTVGWCSGAFDGLKSEGVP